VALLPEHVTVPATPPPDERVRFEPVTVAQFIASEKTIDTLVVTATPAVLLVGVTLVTVGGVVSGVGVLSALGVPPPPPPHPTSTNAKAVAAMNNRNAFFVIVIPVFIFRPMNANFCAQTISCSTQINNLSELTGQAEATFIHARCINF